jgi:hypothetical protein
MTGLSYSWGKYKTVAFQVGGVSEIETIKYAHVSRGTQDLRNAALAMPRRN